MEKVSQKFLRYVAVHTTSDEACTTFPSTARQKDLGRMLTAELKAIGAENVYFDEDNCYVYARISGNNGSEKTMALIAHMDTSPDASGENIKPAIIENYDGCDILLNKEKDIWMSTKTFPEITAYKGQTLIVTDGTTLLGADDKAGVAEIMTAAEYLINHPEVKHCPISICFTPDEEVGAGVDHIDMDRLAADFGYTVDGGALGEIEFENFNAAAASIKINGVSVHPGEAKNKMKNAALMAMEFNALLPSTERPDQTSGYEGFFHLAHMDGEVENASLMYIIRDHDSEKFESKKALISKIAADLNQKYGEGSFELSMKDQYYNMREKIEDGNMFLIDNAVKCMKDLGITPRIQPIRGGTDGARLSFMGLPCPNLCAGGHNFHGRFEYVCIESMEKITELLIALAKIS